MELNPRGTPEVIQWIFMIDTVFVIINPDSILGFFHAFYPQSH